MPDPERAVGDDRRTSGRARLDALVERHPWIDGLFRAGWLARGAVYVVVGVTAVPVALQRAPTSSRASPTGALGRIASVPAGRLLLALLVVGMVLYLAFQLMSLALITGGGFFRWWRRAGHLVASVLYALFAWSAASVAWSGDRPSGDSLIERASRSALGAPGGRWLVGAAGLTTVGVAAYFAHRHVVRRGFVDGLDDIEHAPRDNGVRAGTVVVLGVIGWTGRSIVIALLGWFVTEAAIGFDESEARGFDRALRQTSGSLLGSALVLLCALGLLTYGVFCIVSHRARTVHDIESELEAAESRHRARVGGDHEDPDGGDDGADGGGRPSAGSAVEAAPDRAGQHPQHAEHPAQDRRRPHDRAP